MSYYAYLSIVSQMCPKHSYLDAFNEVLPDMKKSIVGSVNELCDKAIAKKLMTHAEKAGIFVDSDTYKQASRFSDSLAPKIEVHPQVLALLMNMLNGLDLRTCDQIVLRISKWFLLLVGPGCADLMVATLLLCRGNLGTEEDRTLRYSFNKFMVNDRTL